MDVNEGFSRVVSELTVRKWVVELRCLDGIYLHDVSSLQLPETASSCTSALTTLSPSPQQLYIPRSP
jgi:hypothetical protein